jgi:hypothetical protein
MSNTLPDAQRLMDAFAERTGLTDPEVPPRRYLWTDAFAVCNFLELARQTGEESYAERARGLIEQVHRVLGRHRSDDPRSGWISGLSEEEGAAHPTRGGLRIGKPLRERGPAEQYDAQAEWDRDGQYFHYLTKWMVALDQADRAGVEPGGNRWARELAQTAHAAFAYQIPKGPKGMVWKLSIDLTRPQVPALGHYDALDALITYHHLTSRGTGPSLAGETSDAAEMCAGGDWTTNDPLGLGGLLWDGTRVAQLAAQGAMDGALLETLLRDAAFGLDTYLGTQPLERPKQRRLAFRELGLSIGLQALGTIRAVVEAAPEAFGDAVAAHLDALDAHVPLHRAIEAAWLDDPDGPMWEEHRDINEVMLATSLVPEGLLLLQTG